MNEFIEQFVTESREQIERANTALSVLKQSPRNKDLLDEIFRTFHTLKGSAGIMEFAAMESAVHILETQLSAARSGNQTDIRRLIGNCLECIDQVSRWLDKVESSGEIPTDIPIAAATSDSRAGTDVSDEQSAITMSNVAALPGWAEHALAQHPELQARTLVRFTPATDSFFTGQDPLAVLASLPGLLAIDVAPDSKWPSLDALDAFECVSVLTALSDARVQDLRTHLHPYAERCEFVALNSGERSIAQQPLSSLAHKLLEAQLALISITDAQSLAGRMVSAGHVAANVLRCHGHHAAAELIVHAAQNSLKTGSPQLLSAEIVEAMAAEAPTSASPVETSTTPATSAQTLRIETERVDQLVRLTGELTVVKNTIGHTLQRKDADTGDQLAGLRDQHGVLERLITELQQSVLGMRVLPLRTVLQRFPRMVREMARTLNKPANLVIEGDHTEADKTIVELLFEPLLHVIRNAMDHGIEVAAIREQRGKPSIPTIKIRASRQGEHVLVEISDDGGGIDPARIREVATRRGLATSEAFEQMTEAQIIDLIFMPGFSTAAQVTELSGRGVGMDAVRITVERIGGRVAIDSRVGEGTTVTFTLPFSVMMTDVMSVEAGGQMYGIPLDAIVETMRVPIADISSVGAAKVLVHRKRTIPVFELPSVLRTEEILRDDHEAIMVIATIAGQLSAIQVDRVVERQAVMLKPLDGLLSGIPGIAGTTIVGDGRVLLVLDLAEVLQ